MDYTEKLISLVQPNRCLYDCRERDYKNALKKDILWEKISKNLNQSRDAIKTKWKNLKDGYMKYKKNIKGTTGQKKKYTNWVWGPYLTFLDDAIETRSTSTNATLSSQSQSSSSAEVDVERSEIGSAEPELNTYTSATNDEWTEETLALPTSMSQPRKRQRSNDRNAESLEIESAELNTCTSSANDEWTGETLPTSKSRNPRKRQHSSYDNQDNILVDKILGYLSSKEKKDATDLLFASYANSLKRMKPATQASVKIKLAQIFAEAELQDVQTETEKDIAISVTSPTHSILAENQQEVPITVLTPIYSIISTNNDSQHSVANEPEDLSTSTMLLLNNE